MNPLGHISAAERLWRIENADIFSETIDAAAAQFSIQPLAVEKDYWVCEALRAMTTSARSRLVFKGGTSLEKLRIIERFSEDLDLVVLGDFASVNQAKKYLSKLCAAAAAAVGEVKAAQQTPIAVGGKLGSVRRHQYVTPAITKPTTAGLADPAAILIELGQAGGSHPTLSVPVQSLLARGLASTSIDVDAFIDLAAFPANILHPGRTLLEKLLRVNTFAVAAERERNPGGWARIGRQFYDIWALLGNAEVLHFLEDRDRVRKVLRDCAKVSQAFAGDAPVPKGGFAMSPAFTGDGIDLTQLAREHALAMDTLYFGISPAPTFDDVLERVASCQELL